MAIRPFPAKSKFRSQEFIGGALFSDEQGYLVACIDGGARGNPGPAGYGVVIEDEVGRPVAELSEYLGRQTNNYAEYSGLLAALSYAIKHGFKALKVVSDSELMVKQINGQYKVNSPTLKELNTQAMKLIDQLDNLAMDRGTFHKTPAVPPEVLEMPTREVNGVVRGGTVQFLGDPLPEGTLVRIRPAK